MYKTIYLDFDNTIVNTSEAICSLYNEDFSYYKNFTPVRWWEINSWDFIECSCTTKDYINTYFNQPRFFQKLNFMPLADKVIPLLQQVYTVKIVSMGYKPNLKLKEEWIERYLPGIEFIGINLKKHKDKRKLDMKNSVLIDDSSKMLETSNAYIKLCFGDIYDWNRDWKGARVINWSDVKKLLL